MSYLRCVSATAILSLLVSCAEPESPVPDEATSEESLLVVEGPTLIDVRTGNQTENVTILAKAGQIVEIRTNGHDEIPENAVIIDARGKYVIPGLWDLHTHIQSQDELDLFFPLLVAHGVLNVRDAGGLLPREFTDGAKRHKYKPRVVAAGPMVNGPAPEGEDLAAIVDELAAKGVDYIKIASLVPRERFIAIANRAKEYDIHAAGHVPIDMSPTEAAASGLRTMEHMLEIHLAISTREDELRNARVKAVKHEYTIGSVAYPPLEPLLSDWNDEKAEKLFADLADSSTWQVPTLANFRAWAAAAEPTFWDNAGFNLLPNAWLDGWKPDQHFETKDLSKQELGAFHNHLRNWYHAQRDLASRMHAAGVRFLAGTDASAWNFQIPGEAVHEELAIFVEIGMTPLEALQTATKNVAEYLSLPDYDGTVSVGQAANFVLLDADPLVDIENTKKIFGVVSGGEFIGREGLDQLLTSAKSGFEEK